MDTLIAVVFVLILGLAVAQFFIISGAFKRRGRTGQGGEAGLDTTVLGGSVGHKTHQGEKNNPDSGDSSSDGGGDGGGGGGE